MNQHPGDPSVLSLASVEQRDRKNMYFDLGLTMSSETQSFVLAKSRREVVDNVNDFQGKLRGRRSSSLKIKAGDKIDP